MPKNLTPAMRAHLDAATTRLAAIWRITRNDGPQFFFTDHDRDIVFGGNTYRAIEQRILADADLLVREIAYDPWSPPRTRAPSGSMASSPRSWRSAAVLVQEEPQPEYSMFFV